MPIPEAKIKSAKAAADIIALCGEYGLSLQKRGADFFAHCPFHKDDTASLSITPGKNLFHCFGCGEKGNAIQLVQKMEGLSFPKAFEKVAGQNGQDLGQKLALLHEKPASQVSGISEEEMTAVFAKHHKERLERALDSAFEHMQSMYRQSGEPKRYLVEERGLSFLTTLPATTPLRVGYCAGSLGSRFCKEDKAQLIELGLLREDGRPHFEGCIVFPLRDLEGQLRGLYGRKVESKSGASIPGDGRHYYMKGERQGVFAIHDGSFAHGKGSDCVYLTESVLDALSLHQLGVPSVLALHGVNGFTPVHEAWLAAKHIRTVYLLLDGDAAGREASARLALRLKEKGLTVHVLELPGGEDPNSFFSRPLGPSQPSRTLKDLESLPGYPKPPEKGEAWERRWDGEELRLANGKREYLVRGLTGHGLDRMRVTVKCTPKGKPEAFHIDSLDLYVSKARAHFVEAAAKTLSAKPEAMDAEVKSLLAILEEERLLLRDASSTKKQAYVMTKEEQDEALEALQDPKLIQNLLHSYEALGLMGEEKAKLLGYLGAVSRLLDHPLCMLIVSRSGAGKTALQEAICELFPEESLIRYTRLTGQALFYKEPGSLKNKVLSIEEEEGMQQALYSIRTLASSQRLAVATTRSDPKTGKMKTEEYLVEGPVFLLIATTRPDSLDFETRSRFIVTTVDESEAQTERILNARKNRYTLEGRLQSGKRQVILKKYRNMQRLLKPLIVVNPYAPYLDYPIGRLQMRREFGKYMTLISAIALLHQHQREVKTKTVEGQTFSYIDATVEDIALANDLALTFFPHTLDDMAPHTRSLAAEIAKLIAHKGGDVNGAVTSGRATFTRKELRDFCTWGDWPIRQGLEQLVELGYLGKSGQNGITTTYELLHDATREVKNKDALTSPEELGRRIEAARRLAESKQKGEGKA